MRFGPRRGHPVCLFENFFGDFLPLMIVLIISAVRGDLDLLLNNLFIIVLVVTAPLRRLVKFLTTMYAVDEETLLVTSGLFNKTKQQVPLSTITTVDQSEGILHQITGTAHLHIDNASNIDETNTKLGITLRKADAMQLRDLLLAGKPALDGMNLFSARSNIQPADGSPSAAAAKGAVFVPVKHLLFMGALRSKGVFFIQVVAVITGAMSFLGGLFTDLGNTADQTALRLLDRIFAQPAVGFACVLAVFLLFALLCGSIGALIRYYGFRILDSGEAVRIEYGFLKKKSYTIQKSRISGFTYEQSLFMRLFHFGVLHCLAIGYGSGDDEESAEEPLILPFLKETELHAFIGLLLPEMQPPHTSAADGTSVITAAPGSFRYFFYRPAFVASFILFAAISTGAFLQHKPQLVLIGLFFLLYGFGSILLLRRQTAITADDTRFVIVEGGYKKLTTFVKTRHVESVRERASLFKRRKGITSVDVNFIAPMGSSFATVYNVPRAAFDNACRRMLY